MAPVDYHTARFPPVDRLDKQILLPLIGPAWAAVARYDGLLGAVPNPNILVAPLTTREAVLSSRIEGTEATVGEVLGFEAGQEPASQARLQDIHEVLNYRNALRKAEELLDGLPLSLRVITGGTRGTAAGRAWPGQGARRVPKKPKLDGPRGCSVEDATFVPIGATELPDALAAWERYMHRADLDRLLQLAVLHAEFEALHPFLDGNGRLGRMLVPLFMWQCGIIRAPRFYISAYFEAHRDDYYEGLLSVSRDDDWTGWCRLFLEAVRIQAEDNLERAQGILSLYDAMKGRVADLTRSHYAIRALDWIFAHPVFSSRHFVIDAGIPAASARRFLRVNGGRRNSVLGCAESGAPTGRRPGVFLFRDLVNIAQGTPAVAAHS